MPTQVINDGNVIRIINNSSVLLVQKGQIRTIDTVQGDTIRIDIGEGALHHIYVKYADVTQPVLANVGLLRDAIKAMLPQEINVIGNIGGGADAATSTKQDAQTEKLTAMTTLLETIKNTLAWMSNSPYDEPSRVDESVPHIVYYGYAGPGVKPDFANWAIKRVTRTGDLFIYEWADGSNAFSHVWDRRYDLNYSRIIPA